MRLESRELTYIAADGRGSEALEHASPKPPICCPAERIGPVALEQLVQHICLMVGSRTRDVVKSALGFLKVALLLLDVALLGRHLQTMVRGEWHVWVRLWEGGCWKRACSACLLLNFL